MSRGLGDVYKRQVELMPIFEFDETMNSRTVDGKQLLECWGYNTVGFFAPNSSYAAANEHNQEGTELKTLIRELHANGIEVILDVVFNHTAEGNEKGKTISFKGLDNNIYYMLTPDGNYYNFSGCGNTLNCNHPVVQQLILECLRYWTINYRVDGFRFDLASILGRNEDGSPMNNPPLLRTLANDPILSNVKLIAEAWDAGGLYQVGSFPASGRWAEWNGRYRDALRSFLRVSAGMHGMPHGVFPDPEISMEDFMIIITVIMPVIIPVSISLPAMTDLRFMIFIPIMKSTTRQMAGTTPMVLTTTGAGTVVWKVTRMIRKCSHFAAV